MDTFDIKDGGWNPADAKIQQVKDPQLGANVVQISTKTLQPAKVDRVRLALDAKFGVRQADFTSESIGPTSVTIWRRSRSTCCTLARRNRTSRWERKIWRSMHVAIAVWPLTESFTALAVSVAGMVMPR